MNKLFVFNNLYLSIHKDIKETDYFIRTSKDYIFSTDYHEYNYPLNNEYGPINIYNIFKFADFLNEKVNDPRIKNRDLVYYIYNDKAELTNIILLIGCYMIIKLKYNQSKVIFILSHLTHLHNNSYTDCISKFGGYRTSIIDCYKSLHFALNLDLINLDDYINLSEIDGKDMHIIGNKFIAMSCPSINKNNIKELKNRNIKYIIRLNGDTYDKNSIKPIEVYDLYFKDMTVPSIQLIRKFMTIVNSIDITEFIAIHCRAGLGRTGVLICIWLIIKYNFSPQNAIAYIRMIRPGSILGNQGFFLESIDEFKHLI